MPGPETNDEIRSLHSDFSGKPSRLMCLTLSRSVMNVKIYPGKRDDGGMWTWD